MITKKQQQETAQRQLIEIPTTPHRPTQTRDLVILLNRKVIIYAAHQPSSSPKAKRNLTISNLIPKLDIHLRVDDNLLDAIHRYDLRVAIRIAGMVDQAPQVAALGRVHNLLLVNPEQVAAPDTLPLVRALPPLRYLRAHNLPHVLDHLHISEHEERKKEKKHIPSPPY